MQTSLLVIVCVVCSGTWIVAEKLALKHASPMMSQIIAAYAYSALAPIGFMYMKATQEPLSWTTPGIVWTSVACIAAVVGTWSFQKLLQDPSHFIIDFAIMYPMLALMSFYALNGGGLTIQKAIGFIAIAVGVVLVNG